MILCSAAARSKKRHEEITFIFREGKCTGRERGGIGGLHLSDHDHACA